MTITAETITPTASRAPIDRMRRTSLIAGVLYLITFVASLPTLVLYAPVLSNPDFILSSGSYPGISFGAVLDLITALAGIGTAIVLYPVVKRQNETLAIGFVTTRLLEASLLFMGAVSLLSVVTMQQQVGGNPGANSSALVTTADSLVSFHNWTFLVGPAVMAGMNALMLATLMYKSGLVPRAIPLMGLVGAPLILASAVAVMFGVYTQVSIWSAIATILIFCWELSLGVYLTVKGFRPAAILTN